MRRTHMTKVESFSAVRYNLRLFLRLQDKTFWAHSIHRSHLFMISVVNIEIYLCLYLTLQQNEIYTKFLFRQGIYSVKEAYHALKDRVTWREYDIFYPRLRKTTPKSKSQHAKPPLQKQADSKAPNAKDDEAIQIEALRKGKQNRAAVLAKLQAMIYSNYKDILTNGKLTSKIGRYWARRKR